MSDLIFNEAEYLAENPDVAAAVKEGNFSKGCAHQLLGQIKNFDALGSHVIMSWRRQPF